MSKALTGSSKKGYCNKKGAFFSFLNTNVNLGLPLRASRHKELGETVTNPALFNHRNACFITPNKFLSGKIKKKKENGSDKSEAHTLQPRSEKRNTKHRRRWPSLD